MNLLFVVQDDDQQPRLILGTEQTVMSQGYDLLSDPPRPFYNSQNRIVATAVHLEKQLIFVTEDSGHVYRASLYVEGPRHTVISPEVSVNVTPKLISVDWLNDHLYVLGEVQHVNSKVWQISRCDLDGQKTTIAIAGLHDEPSHIEVDPYNGSVFILFYFISLSYSEFFTAIYFGSSLVNQVIVDYLD